MRVTPSREWPDGFFGPAPSSWSQDPDLRRGLDWLLGLLPPGEWEERRAAACRRLYEAALNRKAPGDEKGRFFDEQDTAAWYLFLAEAQLDHPWNIEPVFGSRVVPVITALGRNLDAISKVTGATERAREMLGPDRAQPNGPMFELLVAAQYAIRGADVAFVPQAPGGPRSHDLDISLGGVNFAVECKRMEVGEYGDQDRAAVRRLWGPIAGSFAEIHASVYAKVRFKTPVRSVPYEHLRNKALNFLKEGQRTLAWDDAFSAGQIERLDLGPLRRVLRTDMVLNGSSRMTQLLTGEYSRHAPLVTAMRVKPADNPRYADDCDLAILLRWNTDAPSDVDGRARDILRKLKNANGQLPPNRPSVVHIGFEAVDGDEVEALRLAKIKQTLAEFDPRGKPLEYVYTHALVPESPPTQAWAYDETTHLSPVRPARLLPISPFFVVLPPGASTRPGPHWV